MPRVHATGGIELLRGSHEDTVEVKKVKTASSSSVLMNKISTVIAARNDCETATGTPSPYPVAPNATLLPSFSSVGSSEHDESKHDSVTSVDTGDTGITKPTLKESGLDVDSYNKLSEGFDALTKINKSVNGIKAHGVGPGEIMGTLGALCSAIGVLSPQFAIVGSALGFVASFFNTPNAESIMIARMDQQFEVVNEKLDKLAEDLSKNKLFTCQSDYDQKRLEYLVNFETVFALYNETKTEQHRQDVINQCEDYVPFKYIGMWKDALTGGGGSFVSCVDEFKKDANGRLLYFHYHFTTIVVENLLKAIQYDGLCDGFRNVATRSVKEDYYEDIQGGFNEIENGFYQGFKESVIKDNLSNVNKYSGVKSDPTKAINALKKDFFPDFKYAAINLKGKSKDDVQQFKKVSKFQSYYTGFNKNYDSIFLERDGDNQVVIFFRNRSSKNKDLGSLPIFENCVCNKPHNFCYARTSNECQCLRPENTFEQMENVGWSNMDNFHEYQDRGESWSRFKKINGIVYGMITPIVPNMGQRMNLIHLRNF